MILFWLGGVVLASLIIMFACNSFEDASGHLGRNMPAGVRGATIDAVGSSLPELLTTFVLLFFFLDEDGFSGGVATCAGSAVFNAIVIPAVCIVAVLFIGVKVTQSTADSGSLLRAGRYRPKGITVGKGTILRDGFFFLIAEMVLITFLGGNTMHWWMGGVLMLIYAWYFGFLMWQFKKHGTTDEDDDEDDDPLEQVGFLKALLTLNGNQLFFGGLPLNTPKAWIVLGWAVAWIGLACYGLSHSVVEISHILNIPLYFTTVILAAAATSVPDTVISVKSALNGDYDDAISNAIGSNIFDITVALGFPLLVFGLVYGDVTLTSTEGTTSDVQILRIALLAFTTITFVIFLTGKQMGKVKAILLSSLYFIWTLFIIGRALQWEWLDKIVG